MGAGRTVLGVLTALALAAPAAAQQPQRGDFAGDPIIAIAAQQPQVSLYDLEEEVMCVTCNVPLSVAESPQASRQREQLRGLVDQGLSKDEILDRLVAEYGTNVLALPDADEGIGVTAYAVPLAGGAGVVALLAFMLPRWRRRSPQAAFGTSGGATPTLTDADERRLNADLRRLD